MNYNQLLIISCPIRGASQMKFKSKSKLKMSVLRGTQGET